MNRSRKKTMYGWAELSLSEPVAVVTVGTWILTYHVGEYGIDDQGSVMVAFRFASDMGTPQTKNPKEPNFISATTTGSATLHVEFDPKGFVRPWWKTLKIDVNNGYLAPGDIVRIVIGDTSKGSAGFQMQTFAEERFEFKVLVDPFGTGDPVELPSSPAIRIEGGCAAKAVAILPSLVEICEVFTLVVRVEDLWGNPSPSYRGTIAFESKGFTGLPPSYCFRSRDSGVHRFEGLSVTRAGIYSLTLSDTANDLNASSNAVLVVDKPPEYHVYWGDLHGQSEETVGTNSVDAYFRFARDVAALDFCGHQGNDFQITNPIWRKIKAAVRHFHQPHRFITFLGYEWSGNTSAGGDHNVYFLSDEAPIHRSSHTQVPDKRDLASDRHPLTKIYRELRGQDALVIPHVGGRYADLRFHDSTLEPLVEIYSEWGEFEWLLEEALQRGYKVGFCAGSDDHKGRPGAAAPGRSAFGVYGGLVCALAKELTRESLWEAFLKRRCYCTTGQRIFLSFSVNKHLIGEECIVDGPPLIQVEVIGTVPIEHVELKRGANSIYRFPLRMGLSNDTIRVVWSGSKVRGRSRIAKWDGSLCVDKGRIVEVRGYALDSPLERVWLADNQTVRWVSSTAGDPDGAILRLDSPQDARLTFTSPIVSFSFSLKEIREAPLTVNAGGLDLRVTVEQFPLGTGSNHARFSFLDSAIPRGLNPYYVKVLQVDGAKAWSSPIYVQY